MKTHIEKATQELFLKNAKDTLYSIDKKGDVSDSTPACEWGGCAFAGLPADITIGDIREYIEEIEDDTKNGALNND